MLTAAEPPVHGGVRDSLPESGVADVSGHFLDDIHLGSAVGPPRGQAHRHYVSVDGHNPIPDRVKQGGDRRSVESCAKYAIDKAHPGVDRAGLSRKRIMACIDRTVVNNKIWARLKQEFDKARLSNRHAV